MKFDKEVLEHVAHLSKIKLTDDEINQFTPQMQSILDSAGKLAQVDTSKADMSYSQEIDLADLREDIVMQSLSNQDALANAPFTQSGYVQVWGSTFGSEES